MKTGKFIFIWITIALFGKSFDAQGQGLVQSGGHIVINNGSFLVIDGIDGHYYDTLNGKIKVVSNGYMLLPGNWTNASGQGVFTTNNGEVTLNGGIQIIKGTNTTFFPSLQMSGTGDKILNVNTLVGGGFGGGGNGVLNCNAHFLHLNQRRLVVNNTSNTAIIESGGGIISETDGAMGYGVLQWNLRNSAGLYSIPFATLTKQAIPAIIDIRSPGTNSLDSGFIAVSTYPTDPTLSPNNRRLPTTVTQTLNEYGRENSLNMVDRFWVVASEEYNTKPIGLWSFGYLDSEWDAVAGSSNDITEANLRPIVYDNALNEWVYPGSGSTDVANNMSQTASGQFHGIWTLSDTTICPKALFVWDGNCEFSPIQYTDMSTLSKGVIESWAWDFGDGTTQTITDPVHTFTPSGVYLTQLIVVGPSGCPDTLILPIQIDQKAVADFTFDDDPLVSIPIGFMDNSQHSDNWLWDFGDFGTGSGSSLSHTYENIGLFDVTLIANNAANCPHTIVKQLEINQPSLFLMPTAFSPGGLDALNQNIGLTTLQRVTEYHFVIYNRWGEKLFESDRIDDRWDGTYMGKQVMSGSYIYILSFRDRTMRSRYMNGSILLIR